MNLKKIFLKKKKILILLFSVVLLFTSSNVYAKTDFLGSSGQWTYRLSNGEKVRVEYHYGKPHYHDSSGSANLDDGSAHHSDGKLPKGSTRKILEGKAGNSKEDAKFRNRANDLGREYNVMKKSATNNSKNVSKSFVKKNAKAIGKASRAGSTFVIIAGVLYIVWWLVKIASGWGVALPF